MKTRRTIAWALALMWGATAAVHAGIEYRVLGTIVNPGGDPISGAQVVITTEDGVSREEETNKKGRFSMILMDGTKRHEIMIVKEGFVPRQEPFNTKPGGSTKQTWTLTEQSTAEANALLEMSDEDVGANLYNEGAQAYNAGDTETAKQKFVEAIELSPGLGQAHTILGYLYLQEGDMEQAEATAVNALAIDPQNVSALKVRYEALSALSSADVDAALDDLVAADVTPETAVRVFNRGVAKVRDDDREEALRRFRQALEMDPNLIAAHSAIANLSLSEGKYQEALEISRKMAEIDPESIEAIAYRYEAHRGMGNVEEAQLASEELGRADPTKASHAFYTQGVALFNAGQSKEAIAAFDRVLFAVPDHARAHYMLGRAWASENDLEKAKMHLSRFIELAPDDAEVPAARSMLEYL